jgi:dTDP-4-dehydrorhamnose reductase
VLARIIRDQVIPRPEMAGIFHVAARPISKFDLLTLVAEIYGKSIEIVPDDRAAPDRSLNGERFRAATGYVAPEWRELITQMHSYQ